MEPELTTKALVELREKLVKLMVHETFTMHSKIVSLERELEKLAEQLPSNDKRTEALKKIARNLYACHDRLNEQLRENNLAAIVAKKTEPVK